jgi:carboxymethylenebutenolidase
MTTTTASPMPSPVRTQWLNVNTPVGPMAAYLAVPPAGHGPGLLLLQEIFGVNSHIRGVAEQYALAGFTVLAPDLFWRQQPRVELGYVGAERDQATTLMRALDTAAVVTDLEASSSALRALPECKGGVGALGYCMGGRLAFVAAARAGVDRAVAYYGGGIATQVALAADIRCPVQFHHAGQDSAIPPDAVAAVRTAMSRSPAAATAEFHDYPQAQHGFNCWARASYHPASSALALGRSLQFLAPLFS